MNQSDNWDDGTVNHAASKEWNSGVGQSVATKRLELWDEAVRRVDGQRGYAVEFAHDQYAHAAEYEAEYERLKAECESGAA